MQYRNGCIDCQPKLLSQVYEPLLGLILPELCQRCGAASDGGFCSRCQSDFIRNRAACLVCGIGPLPPERRTCVAHAPDWQLTRVIAPLIYAPPVDTWLHALKYAGAQRLGRAFGQVLAPAVMARRCDVDALVSVPLHRRRLRERGYNQALEIARSLAALMRMPVLRAGIVRSGETRPQVGLDSTQRRRNLCGAFSVRRSLHGLRLAVIDDVITTGATVNALAGELLAAGASQVEAWAVARTPNQP